VLLISAFKRRFGGGFWFFQYQIKELVQGSLIAGIPLEQQINSKLFQVKQLASRNGSSNFDFWVKVMIQMKSLIKEKKSLKIGRELAV